MLTNKELFKQYNIFRTNIKAYRKLNKLTQEQLAEKSDLSVSYVKQIESCREYKNISFNIIFKLAKALNIDVKCLFEE